MRYYLNEISTARIQTSATNLSVWKIKALKKFQKVVG